MVRMQNVFLMGSAKQRVFYMKTFYFHGYKHSEIEWFTTKSRVTLEHILKELSKATEEKHGFTKKKKPLSHLVSCPLLNIQLEEAYPSLVPWS